MTILSMVVALLLVFLSYSSVFSLSFPTFGSKVTPEFVNQVCSETANTKLCVLIFKGNPKTADVDVSGLCEIAIDYAINFALETSLELDAASKKMSNPQLAASYLSCYYNYGDAIGYFTQGRAKADLRDVVGINDAIKIAVDLINQCQRSIVTLPAGVSSPFSGKNTEMIDVSDIITVIATKI